MHFHFPLQKQTKKKKPTNLGPFVFSTVPFQRIKSFKIRVIKIVHEETAKNTLKKKEKNGTKYQISNLPFGTTFLFLVF